MAKNASSAFGNLAPWSEPAWSHGIPSPYYNESHRQLRDALRKYINERVLPDSLDWEEQGSAPRDEQLRWVQSGFALTDVPSEYRPAEIPLPADIQRANVATHAHEDHCSSTPLSGHHDWRHWAEEVHLFTYPCTTPPDQLHLRLHLPYALLPCIRQHSPGGGAA